MRKIFVFLLGIIFVRPVLSDCVSTETVTKCARIPRNDNGGDYRFLLYRGDYTDNSWRFIRHNLVGGEFVPGHYYSGTYAVVNGSTIVNCYMVSPFVATITADLDMKIENPYEMCAHELPSRVMLSTSDITKLPGDKCPDGFYTIPYEIPCGEGLVDVADVPNCANDTTGDFCLIRSTIPCASGITTLRTSSGLAFSLWAEKYTEPSLCVGYNDTVCYINLELGQAAGAININYNGAIYHTVN